MFQRISRFFTFPSHLVPHPGPVRSYPHVELCTHAADFGPVEYFFCRGQGEGPLPVVFFAHGNGELIDQWVEPLSGYPRRGIHLVLMEYRSYGRTRGKPSEEALNADFLAIREAVCAREEVDASCVVYHGRSIGGGVVCRAARDAVPSGLILQSTFTDLYAIARRFGARRMMMGDHFENEATVRTLPCPVVVLHGDADRLIPLAHGRKLAAAAKHGELHIFPGADHNTPIDARPEYWQAIEGLMTRI